MITQNQRPSPGHRKLMPVRVILKPTTGKYGKELVIRRPITKSKSNPPPKNHRRKRKKINKETYRLIERDNQTCLDLNTH